MAEITITIPNGAVQDYLDGTEREHPIPRDPGTGLPMYTKAQWARQRLKRHIVNTVFRQRNYMATLAVNVPVDETGFDVQ